MVENKNSVPGFGHQWSLKELEEHMRKNVEGYGSMVVVGALFEKLYGIKPKIGMSGQQAEFINLLIGVLPDELGST